MARRQGDTTRARLRRRLLGTTGLALAIAIAAGPARAREAEHDGAAPVAFKIAEQDLDRAVLSFAKRTGVRVFYDAAKLGGKRTRGVTGTLTPDEALAAILAESGFAGRWTSASSVRIGRAGEPETTGQITRADASERLDEIAVEGAGDGGVRPPATGVVGQPPPPYAGGQVASGTRVGLLGNQSVFNTPFNITGFTDKLIRDQQSRAIADVVLNDPSVQLATPRGGPQDQFVIRGFRTFQQDILFDGLGGLVDYRRPAIDNVERVEILKGPSALLNGVTVNGNIGALINFIPKRATDAPITRYTVGYASRAEFGNYVDIGRRFGANNEWGIRFNGSYRNGPGEIDRSSIEWGFAGLGLDYRGERLRVSVDAGIQKQEADPFITLRTVLPGFPIPRAPSARTNLNQNWEFSHTNNRFISTRVEYDVTDWLTVYGAYGLKRGEDLRFVGTPQIFNAAGDFRQSFFYEPFQINASSYDAGARAVFDTGPLRHKVVVSTSAVQQDTDFFSSVALAGFVGNIYNPVLIPRPDTSRLPREAGRSGTLLNRGVAVADVISMFDERVILTAGFRYQEVGAKSYGITPGPAFGLGTARYKEDAVTPAVALVVKPWEPLSLYANYIEGLQQGPVAPLQAVNAGQIFPAFVAKQIEFGAKYDFGVFGVAVSAFEITRPSAFLDPASLTFGVNGEQVNRGLELNLFGEPLPGLRLIGGIAAIEGLLTRTAGGTFDGNIAPGVPLYQISLYAEQDLPPWLFPNLTLTGRVLHSASQFYDRGNTQSIPDWTRLDLGLRYVTEGYNGKPMVLRASVENVFDSNYYQTAIDGLLSQGYPRVFLLSAQFDF